MTVKVNDNLQGKYKNTVFQILKICKAFSNFDINSAIRKNTHWFLQSFGNKVIERFSFTIKAEHPNSFIHVLI